MKFFPGYPDLFISPLTGKLWTTTTPILPRDYIWTGGREGNGDNYASPILIDLKLDLIGLRFEIDEIETASFVLGFPNKNLPYAQVLSFLEDGILKHNKGIVEIAIPGEDYATKDQLDEDVARAEQAADDAEKAANDAQQDAQEAQTSANNAKNSAIQAQQIIEDGKDSIDQAVTAGEASIAVATATGIDEITDAALAEVVGIEAAGFIAVIAVTAAGALASASAAGFAAATKVSADQAEESAQKAQNSASSAAYNANNAASSATAASDYLNTLLNTGLNALPNYGDVNLAGFKLTNVGYPSE
jgi:hypothetical protein